LRKSGTLIMELGQGQAEELRKIVGETGQYHSPEILKDLAGIERVIVARKT
jgi:methylase of polypeptide subunit release factors